eukprot:3950861-Pyramimonas_sp.AAC.1
MSPRTLQALVAVFLTGGVVSDDGCFCLQGNLNWMASREAIMTHPVWNKREPELRPICDSSISDSGNLDRVAELLVRIEFSVGGAAQQGLVKREPPNERARARRRFVFD